jgi:hypothetical protein
MRIVPIAAIAALLLATVTGAEAQVGVGRRRTMSTVNVDSSQRLTVFGDRVCPTGFTPLIVGNIFAFQQKVSGSVPQFGGVDPACWKNPPLETDFLGNWTTVGDCVVCEPAPAGSPTSTGTTTESGVSSGGGSSAPVHGTSPQ